MTFPYIRAPLLPGENTRGGGMNNLIDRVNELRQEIAAMQATLGANPQGSATNLLERLKVRHATSGIQRGMLYPIRAVSDNDGLPAATVFSDQGGATNVEMQAFASEIVPTSGSQANAFYGTAANPTTYTTPPTRVLVWPTIRESDDIINNGVFWRIVSVQRNSIASDRVTINLNEMVDDTGSPQWQDVGSSPTPANPRRFNMVCIGGQI